MNVLDYEVLAQTPRPQLKFCVICALDAISEKILNSKRIRSKDFRKGTVSLHSDTLLQEDHKSNWSNNVSVFAKIALHPCPREEGKDPLI